MENYLVYKGDKMSNKKTTADLVEHYVYTAAGTAVGITVATLKIPGHHNYKSVLWALVAGIVAPALAKLNVRGLVAKLAKKLKLNSADTAIAASVAETALADATKAVNAAVAENATSTTDVK